MPARLVAMNLLSVLPFLAVFIVALSQEQAAPSGPSKEEIARQKALSELDVWQAKQNKAQESAESALKQLNQLLDDLENRLDDKAAAQKTVSDLEQQAVADHSAAIAILQDSFASAVGKLKEMAGESQTKQTEFLALNSSNAEDASEVVSAHSVKTLAKLAKKSSKKIYKLQTDQVKMMKKRYEATRSQAKQSPKDLYKKVKHEAKLMMKAARKVERYSRKAGNEERDYEGNYSKVEHESEKLSETAEEVSEKAEDLVEEFYENVEDIVEDQMETLEDKAEAERKQRDMNVKKLFAAAKAKAKSEAVSLAALPSGLQKLTSNHLFQSLVLPCMVFLVASITAAAGLRTRIAPGQYPLLG